MKRFKFALALSVFALGVASAATHHVTVSDTEYVNGTQLKPGDYNLVVQGDKAIFKSGKTVVEAPAKVETEGQKFDETSLRSENVNGKTTLEEIRLGGTHTKIVFEHSPAGTASQTGGGF